MKDMENRVRTIIAEHLEVDEKRVVDDATLDILDGDSLDSVELAMALEEEFGIEITDIEGEDAQTFKELVALVQRKCQE